MSIQVHHTISLGCRCHTSYALKYMGLKKYSCPFDWLACDIYGVLEILKSDFTEFLKPEHLHDHKDGHTTSCGHKIYGNTFFHHFNPRVKEHMDYYIRCVNRFKAVKDLYSHEHVLYIHNALYIKPTEDVIYQLHHQLQRYRGSDNFTLLFIYYSDSNASKTSFQVSSFVGHPSNVMLVDASIRQPTDGVVFTHSDDIQGFCEFMFANFDFSEINPNPFNMSDIDEESSYISGICLQ